MQSLKLYTLLQKHLADLNKLAVNLREEKTDTAAAREKAAELSDAFSKAIKP